MKGGSSSSAESIHSSGWGSGRVRDGRGAYWVNFQVGELGSVSTIFQDRGQEKALPHRQKNDRAVRVVAEPRCCSSDGSDVLADWRAGSRGAIVGWRDGRIARWMGVDGTGGWAARCEAVGSRARTKRRTGRRKPRAGRWSVEREKLGPERRLEAGGRSRGCGLRAAGCCCGLVGGCFLAGSRGRSSTRRQSMERGEGRRRAVLGGKWGCKIRNPMYDSVCRSWVGGGVKSAETIPLKDVAGWWEPGRSQD